MSDDTDLMARLRQFAANALIDETIARLAELKDQLDLATESLLMIVLPRFVKFAEEGKEPTPDELMAMERLGWIEWVRGDERDSGYWPTAAGRDVVARYAAKRAANPPHSWKEQLQ
jgi:hypothetical protein